MNIIYLINILSKTSVPVSWYNYIKKNFNAIDISLISIKQFKLLNLKTLINSHIVHGHHIKAMAIFIFFNLLFRKKIVYTVHGSYLYLSDRNKKLLDYILKKVDKVIFVNSFLYDVLPSELKSKIEHKYKIILNGVDLNFTYQKIDVYNKFKIQESDTIIFHPARFVKEKNHINIIKAFHLLSKENETVKLVLAGDGVLKTEIIETIEELGLQNSVVLVGLIDREEVYNFLEKCDLFIMPSVSEGLNIAFLEAMSMKSKVLVSDIEQFTYPFEHYKIDPQDYNVYFANPNNIDEIYKGFNESLRTNKNIDFDMNIFSLKNMILEYETLYKELLK